MKFLLPALLASSLALAPLVALANTTDDECPTPNQLREIFSKLKPPYNNEEGEGFTVGNVYAVGKNTFRLEGLYMNKHRELANLSIAEMNAGQIHASASFVVAEIMKAIQKGRITSAGNCAYIIHMTLWNKEERYNMTASPRYEGITFKN